MNFPDVEDFDDQVEDLVDFIAGDGYEGWNNYWIGHARFNRIATIRAELRAWQEEVKALVGTDNVDQIRPGQE